MADCTCLQVLFNYGPNYITTYCNPVGTYNLADSITAPGFSAPSNNPPQPVSPCLSHACRYMQILAALNTSCLPAAAPMLATHRSLPCKAQRPLKRL